MSLEPHKTEISLLTWLTFAPISGCSAYPEEQPPGSGRRLIFKEIGPPTPPAFLYREHFPFGIWHGELGFDVHSQACTEVDAAISPRHWKWTARVRRRL